MNIKMVESNEQSTYFNHKKNHFKGLQRKKQNKIKTKDSFLTGLLGLLMLHWIWNKKM